VGEDATRAREVALRALRDAGLQGKAVDRMERLLSTVVMGFALSEATGRFEGIDVDQEFDGALQLLARVVGG
jgi:hypothetical protein